VGNKNKIGTNLI